MSDVAAGEPERAVLVVRDSDGLPGQCWRACDGPWNGPRATAFVRGRQQEVFDYWRTHDD